MLRPSLNTLPPGLAREGRSFLADDRRVPEEEWEKNSTELSGSYRAAIMGALYPCGNSTSKLVQELAEAQHEGQTEGREQEKERLKLKKVRTIKLYREGYIEEAEFQGEMAAVELAIRKLDVPEVGGVTYDEVVEAGEHIPGMACTGYLAHPFGKSHRENESDSLDSLKMDEQPG